MDNTEQKMYKIVNLETDAVEGFYNDFMDAMIVTHGLAVMSMQEYAIYYGDEVAYKTTDEAMDLDDNLDF